MDSAKNHLGDKVEQAFTDVDSSIKIIHGRMTPLLQFLDTHVNKLFKDIMKEKWEDWIVNGEAEFTEKGNTDWKKVATDELIIKEFHQCGYFDMMAKLQICIQDYKKQSRNAKFQRR